MVAPTFAMSAETRLIRQELEKLKPGEVISYADLSAACGRPIQGTSHYLQAARASLEKYEDYVFTVEYGKGVRRCTDADILQKSRGGLRSIRRKSVRVQRNLGAVEDYAAFTPREKNSYNVMMAISATIEQATSTSTIKRVERAASKMKDEISVRETIALLLT